MSLIVILLRFLKSSDKNIKVICYIPYLKINIFLLKLNMILKVNILYLFLFDRIVKINYKISLTKYII